MKYFYLFQSAFNLEINGSPKIIAFILLVFFSVINSVSSIVNQNNPITRIFFFFLLRLLPTTTVKKSSVTSRTLEGTEIVCCLSDMQQFSLICNTTCGYWDLSIVKRVFAISGRFFLPSRILAALNHNSLAVSIWKCIWSIWILKREGMGHLVIICLFHMLGLVCQGSQNCFWGTIKQGKTKRLLQGHERSWAPFDMSVFSLKL